MSKPKQVSESLNIPTSSLRRLSKEFEAYLSPHKKGEHRDYTIADIATLRKIRDLLNEGMNYDDIKSQLSIIETSPNKSMALELIDDYTQALLDIQSLMQSYKLKIENQDQRIKALEDWIALPWYQKIIRKPPKN